MEIQGEGFLLRPWRTGDEESLVRHADDFEVWRNLTNRFPHPYGVQDARDWIARCQAEDGPTRNFAIVVEGSPVGGAGIERGTDLSTRTAEVGYWLGRACWGRGLATGAVRCLCRHAFARFDFQRLEAVVMAWNPASRRVLEKADFSLESRRRNSIFKDGQLIDAFAYVRFREGNPQTGSD